MKLTKEERNAFITGLLPLLMDGFESTDFVKEVEGVSLIQRGITKDVHGKQIHPGTMYKLLETSQVAVNHKRRLLQVIEKAQTRQGMKDDLARYLAKYAKSKQVISDSIRPPVQDQ